MSTTFEQLIKDPSLQKDLIHLQTTDPEAHLNLMSMYNSTIETNNPLNSTPRQIYDDFVNFISFMDEFNNTKKADELAEEQAKLTLAYLHQKYPTLNSNPQ